MSRDSTLFDMGGGGGRGEMMAPPNVLDHCAQTLRRRKLKLVFFLNINPWSIKKKLFLVP